MIKNYLKIALRNLRKYKTYSFINISGLAIGLACCLLIFLFVQDELKYDRFHEKANRIFRLVDGFDLAGDQAREYALSSAPFAPTLKQELPEVEDAVRLFPGRRRLVTYQGKKFYEDGIFFTDNSLFNIFTLPLIRGKPASALESPGSIIISTRIAEKYFGSEDPVGKSLNINDQDYLVTGVMKEMPRRSHFHADIFASMKTLEVVPRLQENYFKSWARHEFYTYLLLRSPSSAVSVEAKLPGFIKKHAEAQVQSILGSRLFSNLQPLERIHLYSHRQYELGINGDIKVVAVFSVIAVFILLIACINFMNLSTARAVNRSKEVGLRKVVGASRKQLIRQFLGESVILTFIAMALASLIVNLLLPYFNSLLDKEISWSQMTHPLFLAGMLFLVFFVGGISGGYPAAFISRYQPAHAIKKTALGTSAKSNLRKGLVIFQFSISIILIISTLVVLGQLDYMRNRKLGFNKEHVVIIPIREHKIRLDAEAIKADLRRNPNILSSTISIGVPGGVVAGDAIKLLTDEGDKTLTVNMIYTDHDYISTMGIEIVSGRDFSKAMATDESEAFIINQAAVRQLQLADPLNTRFEWGDKKQGRVIGVVKDFQFQSLREEISPLVLHIQTEDTYIFAVRIQPRDIPGTLAFLREKWEKLDPRNPFEFSFMDEEFNKIYRSEEKLGRIFSIFSGLAVLIAALGLFGLTLFMVQQRAKEIGIRKVLGASISNICLLLSREFALLVLLANLVSWPAAFFLMRQWLQNFAYRIPLSPLIFLLAAGIAFLVAIFTIGFQALKAASSDPVNTIRYE